MDKDRVQSYDPLAGKNKAVSELLIYTAKR